MTKEERIQIAHKLINKGEGLVKHGNIMLKVLIEESCRVQRKKASPLTLEEQAKIIEGI